MFTDGPVTPLHLETLIELLRRLGTRKMTRDAVYGVLQPKSVTDSQDQSKNTVRAAIELNLVVEKDGFELELTESGRGRRSVRECVLDAIDQYVLASTDVEYYFALFYSYMLGLNKNTVKGTRDDWVKAFNRDVFGNEKQINPFNAEKWSGLHRWFVYAGLGWNDPSGEFQCSPYERVKRKLPDIFSGDKKVDDDTFMDRLAVACPELDGGDLFKQANRNAGDNRQCTLGLSHALTELHLDSWILLYCSPDSGGWSLQQASPPNDGKTLLSDRIDFIEIRKGAK
jgi:hypothetical protein